jgi:hypothetical protein
LYANLCQKIPPPNLPWGSHYDTGNPGLQVKNQATFGKNPFDSTQLGPDFRTFVIKITRLSCPPWLTLAELRSSRIGRLRRNALDFPMEASIP